MRDVVASMAAGLGMVLVIGFCFFLFDRFWLTPRLELDPKTVALLREANCKRVTEESEVKMHAIRICTEHMVGCEVSLQDIEAAITAKRRALACQ